MRNKIIKSTIYAIGLSALLVSASCKKYLEVENPLKATQDVTFSTVENTRLALVGVYGELPGDNGYGSRLSLLYPLGADDFKVSGAWNPDEGRGISHYGAGVNNKELKEPFNQLYRGIERANIAIKYIPLSPAFSGGSDEDKAQMNRFLGEALTLRAQYYQELIRNWGDVPASFVPSADVTNLYLPKTDRDVIYDRLLEDLKKAEELVPWRSETTENMPTRITKGFVKGLRARIALARGGYSLRRETNKMEQRADSLTYFTIARDECKEIIEKGDHGLNPNFEDLFKSLHRSSAVEPAHEILFAVGGGGAGGTTNTKLAYGNGIRITRGNLQYGQANGALEAIPTYFYEFDKTDLRRDVTLAFYLISATNEKEIQTSRVMRDGKFRKYWTNVRDDSQNLGVSWPILRYADVLLMYAEAENALNGPGNAVNALKEVRRRSFPSSEWSTQVDQYVNNAAGSKASFRAAVKQERLLEFGGEGIRKYDLIRWNDIFPKFQETWQKMKDFRDGKGKYERYPTVIYYKKSQFTNAPTVYAELAMFDLAGGSVNDVFFKPAPGSAPSGYTSVNWREAFVVRPSSTNPTPDPDQYINGSDGLANQFRPNSRELLPISQDIINENYNLTQDYGY